MYSWEIRKFLEDRNYNISEQDLLFILNIKNHPQINHIKFNDYDNSYDMWSSDGEYFHFKVKSRRDAKDKKIKRRK